MSHAEHGASGGGAESANILAHIDGALKDNTESVAEVFKQVITLPFLGAVLGWIDGCIN